MPENFHIQISVYVKADTIYGAKAAANTIKLCLEALPAKDKWLDEVIIDSVEKERTPEEIA